MSQIPEKQINEKQINEKQINEKQINEKQINEKQINEKKVCAIVGMGPGMGMALAKRFGAEGFSLGLIARRADALSHYVDTLTKDAISARAFAADIIQPASLTAALNSVTSELGAPSVLIYNASVLRPAKPTKLGIEALVQEFRINVGGALIAAQAVIPAMKRAAKGTILITGGGLALQPMAEFASLSIGKTGVRHLAYLLSDELAPAGIHVATVTITGLIKAGSHFDPPAIAEKYWELHQQQRETWQEEIVFDGE